MSPSTATAKITLSYPLYAADFDPDNSSLLLVGGGGGEGRSGVGNKITLLNSSKKHELSEIIDVNLSRDEDSVTSLAYAQSNKQWATAFAGINSSSAEQQKGKNEHLRSFLLEYPPQRTPDSNDGDKRTAYKGETKALGKASLFSPSTGSTKETFQRILRLSRKKRSNGPRLGAVATGLAPEGEIVLFKADTSRPRSDDVIGRIALGKKEEAADLDITELESNEGAETKFRIAYCTDHDIYYADVDYTRQDSGTTSHCVYSTPHPVASSKARPRFRNLRFITPKTLLVLQNKPNGTGAELLLLNISGKISIRKSLHKRIKSGTALSVAHLDASTESGFDQHVVAVAGADTSITFWTLDRFVSSPKGNVKLRKHSFIASVHPTSITSLAFSTFHAPTTNWNVTPPQYLKLVSTSIANTCVVHTLPLLPSPSVPEPDTPARYLLHPTTRSNVAQNAFSTLVAAIVIGIVAFFLQAFTEIRGATPEYIGAKGWLSQDLHDLIARPYMFEDTSNIVINSIGEAASVASQAAETPIQTVQNVVADTQEKLGLRDLLAQRNIGSDTSDEANTGHEILVRDSAVAESGETELSADLVQADEVVREEHKAKRWEELAEHEKKAWKQRLVEAGQWTVDEGEAVLKGILFSGLGNLVGGVVGG